MEKTNLHFVQPDLQVRYSYDNRLITYNAMIAKEFYVFVLFCGKSEIQFKNKIYYAKPGDVFLGDYNECFCVKFGGVPTEFLEIRFQAKAFHEIDREIDVLLPFYQKGLKIYNSNFDNEDCRSAVKNIKRSLETRSSRVFVLSGVLQLLCELYYINEQINPPTTKDTDSNYTKIIDYIAAHIFEKLTLKDVASHVFLSERSITNNIRRICGESFHELITDIRLDRAYPLVNKGDTSLVSIAAMCGFDTYSTFYRAYKKRYGYSPKQRQDSLKKK